VGYDGVDEQSDRNVFAVLCICHVWGAAAKATKLLREMDSLVAMDRNNIIIEEVGCRSSLCLVAILVLGACSARNERDLPDLPRPTIANFRPQIRDRVQRAYDDVKARPKDAESNGRLGMLLQ